MINAVSHVIVKKLQDMIDSEVMTEVKQDLYESCTFDNGRTNDKVRNLEQRMKTLIKINAN